MRNPRRLLATFGLSLILAGGGCVLLEQLGLTSSGPVFSHANHGEKEELECKNCHTTFAAADKAGMPRRKVCILCHEGVDEDKPAEKKIAVLFKEDASWSRVTAIPADVVFSHKVHHDAKVACGECHEGIEKSNQVTRLLRVGMKRCTECHAAQSPAGEISAAPPPAQEGKPGAYTPKRAPRESYVANDCAVCHRETRTDTPPSSHALNWKRLHGTVSRGEAGKTADRCALCHTEASCSSCHREQAPGNHTTLWKDRGHGLSAGIDRSSCAVCHQPDACDRCHRDAAPRSHVGSWGSPQDRHCYSCHLPVRNEGCATCHKGALHRSAPRRPANDQHAAATESQCRTCHSVIGIPHPDNGDSCRACH